MMKKMIAAFIMGIMSVSCMSIKLPSVLPRDITIPPDSTREVIAINLPFVESWKWTGLAHNFVVISGDRIIISSSAELANQKITVFDAHTGEIIWKSENIKGVNSLQADNQQVYVGTSNYVRAYDIKTGQLLWEEVRQPQAERGSVTDLYVYPDGEHLKVYDTRKGNLHILDAKTGKVVEERRVPSFFYEGQDTYYLADHRVLRAVDKATGSTLWSQKFEGRIYNWPAFTGDTMVINADGQLFALGTKTGDIIWQSTDARFVTSVDEGGDFLYAIREDAAIAGLDPSTGKLVGVIEMRPNQAPRDTGAGTTAYYAIAASENFIAAYYSNSQELFVFERIRDGD